MYRKQRILALLYICGIGFSFLFPIQIHALPTGAKVVAGKVNFQRVDANTLVINTSDKAIVNYASFNLEATENVKFRQPNSSSSVLNRVLDQAPSKIYGNISANGHLFLVNPYGIYFGPKAVVSSGSLVVSSLNIRDNDFLEGKYVFTADENGLKSKISNGGTLCSTSVQGAVVLLSPSISNTGVISARTGKVVLASTKNVTLDFNGDGLINFALNDEIVEGQIDQAGIILMSGGDIFLQVGKANQVIKSVINMDGVETNKAIVKSNGHIHLNSGSNIQARNVNIVSPNILARDGNVKINAVENVSLVATQGVINLKDTTENSFNIHALGNLRFEAEQIDIAANSHPESMIVSGNHTSFICDEEMFIDGRFSTGGNFKLTKFDGTVENFKGKQGVEIHSLGSVKFGNYTGGSLKVESNEGIGIGGVIAVANGPLILDGNILLSSNTTMTSGDNIIDISGTINSNEDGEYSLSIDAGEGLAVLGDAIGDSSKMTSLFINAMNTDQNGPIKTLGPITFNGYVNIRSDMTTNCDITINGDVFLDLLPEVTLNTAGGSGNIILNGEIDGGLGGSGYGLRLNAGTGSIIFNQAIGRAFPLLVLSAHAALIDQNSSLATIGPVSYTGNLLAGGDMSTQSGDITIKGDLIRDTQNDVTFKIGPGVGNILIAGAINGDQPGRNLTLNADRGSIIIVGPIGDIQPLNSLVTVP